MTDLAARIATALRREREGAALSVSELARRAGVSKATVSQLESGGGNPSVETLWALATAIGIPFAALVDAGTAAPRLVRADDATAVAAADAPYAAALLSASPPHVRRDIYLITAEPGPARESRAHSTGTTEHVVLLAGRALVGPAAEPFELGPGDYLAYPGDAPHVFEALLPATRAVLVSELR
ncbi:helix-turn-helix domain-containing protein [Microbacterium sp. NPDC091313]